MIRWLATFVLIWFVYTVRHVFPPIIVGAIIAYLLLPVVQQLSVSMKISVRWATAIIYITGAVILGLLAWWLGPGIVREVSELANNRAEIIGNVVKQLNDMFHWQADVESTTATVMNSIGESVAKPTEIVHLGGMLSHGLLGVLVCVVSSIYFTVDSEVVFRFFLHYVPAERRPAATELTAQMNKLLSRYMQGQLILIIFMSTVTWCFLHFVMHMKHAVPVAILSGFLEIIPVLGPILATTTATLVGIAQLGPQAALWIIVFYTIARWIEDYVVVPHIVGHAVKLHPLAVIFAVLCGEKMAGALGMLIAIPVAACVKLSIDSFFMGKTPLVLPSDHKQPTPG
jgi:predicted PurR-regulated permease PerM